MGNLNIDQFVQTLPLQKHILSNQMKKLFKLLSN
jgi:hypothetical protein